MSMIGKKRWRWSSRFGAGLCVGVLFLGVLVPVVNAETAAAPGGGSATDIWGFLAQVWQNLFNSRGLMQTLGQPEWTAAAFIVLNVIVFTETGLLIGFFLPGDSLLVTAGLIAASPDCGWNLMLLLGTLSASAIVGDSVGYSIGYQTGPKIFNREKSLFFNRDHLFKAQDFYERYGGITIVLARFMPILRTFAPVVAGVGQMKYVRFLFYNIFGGLGWVFSMVLIGYFLPHAMNPVLRQFFGSEFHVEEHVEKVIIIVVLVSIAPMCIVGLRQWLNRRKGSATVTSADTNRAAVVQAE